MTTRVPFTRANLQFYTGIQRTKLEAWLDELVGSGVLEVDSDDAGELVWSVIGAQRAANGTTDAAAAKKLEQLKGEIRPSRGNALMKRAPDLLATFGNGPPGGDKKSLIASGALSFFLGPIGWLYAAPLKETLPAIGVYLVLMMVLPHVLLAPLLGLIAPLSAIAGTLYAWRHNQRGERTSMLDLGRTLPPRR
ncbi:MAG TPA: hypothetical protein VIA18_10365 [Polyangia bacterium]|jgi:hypothetical protein|nr:hypothetical protein [Polyangia bacterium]HWE28464.1 hypothetical protein [Polyangia bacterium]